MRTGITHLPLHTGRAPRWLFERMRKLAREITIAVVDEYGPGEMLNRLSDPFWFQAFGCVLGFDWHSSGLTTTVGGALKDGIRGIEKDIGFYAAGGKGATSRKTPSEIEQVCEKLTRDPAPLVYASRMSAKVDSAAVQDGFQLYHHNFFFTSNGHWCVVQQGMNEETHYARRYHWSSAALEDFVCEPHTAVCSDSRGNALNMVAEESENSRKACAQLASEHPDKLTQELNHIETLTLPRRHDIQVREDINSKYVHKILLKTYERKPENFETLLGLEGVGPKTIRALSLIGELIYGAKPSFRDPARFSYAHGGKDGHPYRVNRRVYDQSIEFFKKSLNRSRIDHSERVSALKRLGALGYASLELFGEDILKVP